MFTHADWAAENVHGALTAPSIFRHISSSRAMGSHHQSVHFRGRLPWNQNCLSHSNSTCGRQRPGGGYKALVTDGQGQGLRRSVLLQGLHSRGGGGRVGGASLPSAQCDVPPPERLCKARAGWSPCSGGRPGPAQAGEGFAITSAGRT